MKTILLAAALAAASLSVSGCASGVLGGNAEMFLKDIQTCDRHYEGAIGGPAVNASFKIDCKASAPPTQAEVEAVIAPAAPASAPAH